MYKLIVFGEPEACSETTRVGLIHTRDRFSRERLLFKAFHKGSTNPKRDVLDLLKNLFSKRGSGKAPYRILIVRSRTLNSSQARAPGKLTRKYNEINGLGKTDFQPRPRVRNNIVPFWNDFGTV